LKVALNVITVTLLRTVQSSGLLILHIIYSIMRSVL
jgi:hypothetical protein